MTRKLRLLKLRLSNIKTANDKYADLQIEAETCSEKLSEAYETIEAVETKYKILLEEMATPPILEAEIKPFLPPKKRKKKDIL